jgi:hypothetical protein
MTADHQRRRLPPMSMAQYVLTARLVELNVWEMRLRQRLLLHANDERTQRGPGHAAHDRDASQ